MRAIRLVLLGTGLLALLAACGGQGPDQDLPAGMLYRHDFGEDTGEWILESDMDANAVYSDGQLVLKVKAANLIAWAELADRKFTDFALEIDARQLAGPDDNSYGVLFRMRSPAAFYRFDISGDGYYEFSRRNDDETNPWTTITDWVASPAIQQGANSNKLEIQAVGSHFTFYVNDQLVAEADDASYRSGGIGLDAGSFSEGGVEIAFDKLVISEP
jgi:hypothetical protein